MQRVDKSAIDDLKSSPWTKDEARIRRSLALTIIECYSHIQEYTFTSFQLREGLKHSRLIIIKLDFNCFDSKVLCSFRWEHCFIDNQCNHMILLLLFLLQLNWLLLGLCPPCDQIVNCHTFLSAFNQVCGEIRFCKARTENESIIEPTGIPPEPDVVKKQQLLKRIIVSILCWLVMPPGSNVWTGC